jgi:hypothetical protein
MKRIHQVIAAILMFLQLFGVYWISFSLIEKSFMLYLTLSIVTTIFFAAHFPEREEHDANWHPKLKETIFAYLVAIALLIPLYFYPFAILLTITTLLAMRFWDAEVWEPVFGENCERLVYTQILITPLVLLLMYVSANALYLIEKVSLILNFIVTIPFLNTGKEKLSLSIAILISAVWLPLLRVTFYLIDAHKWQTSPTHTWVFKGSGASWRSASNEEVYGDNFYVHAKELVTVLMIIGTLYASWTIVDIYACGGALFGLKATSEIHNEVIGFFCYTKIVGAWLIYFGILAFANSNFAKDFFFDVVEFAFIWILIVIALVVAGLNVVKYLSIA